MRIHLLKFGLLLGMACSFSWTSAQHPNILLIIADDLGVDYSNGYHTTAALMPTTPTLDSLRANGITFENAFSTPKCTPSRATIMSGKHGIKTGVLGTPGHLDTTDISLFRAIEAQTNGLYSDAVIGKWHISFPTDPFHPRDHGIDYYTGLLTSMVSDYYSWDRTENGVTTTDTNYVTSALTDASIDWINAQNQPWFLWLAHVAPHGPFHDPPDSLHTITNTGNNRRKYVAMIEAIDHELGRMFDSIPQQVLDSTIVIFIGDNGTPVTLIQDYPVGHGKSTVYQGGIRVPFIVSGAGVTRSGVRESAMVHITDIYATLLEITGANLPGGIYNSLSFKHLLDNSPGATRDYNYSEFTDVGTSDFAIRDERYKLIQFDSAGRQEFYDLLQDSLETTDLMLAGLDSLQMVVKADLEQEANMIRTSWSCRDHIQNGDEQGIDCGGSACAPCVITNANQAVAPSISVFPNPVEENLKIVAGAGNYALEMFDVRGVRRAHVERFDTAYTLDVSSLPAGLYLLRIVDETQGSSLVKTIVKQ